MKKSNLIALVLGALVSTSAMANPLMNSLDKGQDLLTGDTRLACEAILCLSQGYSSGECRKSVRKYYSIKARRAWKTAKLRREFLNLCPKNQGVDTERLSKMGLDLSKELDERLLGK